MRISGIIPARYESARFPGKPLAMINGKSMIKRVYEQAFRSKSLDSVFIATDDDRIFSHCKEFTENVIMTDPAHPSGTDRCYEALKSSGENAEVVINIQGDEPYIDPAQIDLLAGCFKDQQTQIATLKKKMKSNEEVRDENIVKVIADNEGFALYFSRGILPHVRNAEGDLTASVEFYKHIGIYGYRTSALEKIVQLPPSSLEKAEKLEQLRWLQNGYKIKVAETKQESVSVDRPEDLEKF